MQTVESKPATGSSATPEPDDLVKPETPYSAEREKDEAERKVLETERDGSLSKARALQLLRDGAVTAETRARTEYVTSRLRDIDEREIALEPLVRKKSARLSSITRRSAGSSVKLIGLVRLKFSQRSTRWTRSASSSKTICTIGKTKPRMASSTRTPR